MQIKAFVQSRRIDVERIRILHRELTHPQQSSLWPRLIAKLRLNLVPDLRQLLVAAQLVPRNARHDLLMRHAQAQLSALAVLQAKHVVAHHRPASALLPNLARMNRRQIKLLPDRVHLLAHNRDDLVQRPLPKKEVVVNPRAKLPDIPGPQQKFMAGHFGIRRGLAQSRNKQFRPAMHKGRYNLSARDREARDINKVPQFYPSRVESLSRVSLLERRCTDRGCRR